MTGIYSESVIIEIAIYILAVVLLIIGYLNESRIIQFETKIKRKIYRAICRYEEHKLLGIKK